MMDGKAGDHGIKLPQSWQRKIHVVLHDADAGIVVEPLPHRLQHGGGEVDCDRVGVWMPLADQRQQAPIAGT